MTTMNDAQREEFLKGLGLNPSAPALKPETPAKVTHQPAKQEGEPIRLAPEGMDPRSMPVEEIVFDPRLLDNYPSLTGDGLKAASDYVFSLYKSHGRNKERNGALHRKITTFLTTTRRNRETGNTGFIKEGIQASSEQRDMAAILASAGVTPEQLFEMLQKG